MNLDFFKNLVEQKLLSLHTCYLAKVLSTSGNMANIQPLSLVKPVGGNAKKQAVIENVPINRTVLYVLQENSENLTGKVAIVICCERDISQTRKGIFALPSLRRHSLSDSIIIGYL